MLTDVARLRTWQTMPETMTLDSFMIPSGGVQEALPSSCRRLQQVAAHMLLLVAEIGLS